MPKRTCDDFKNFTDFVLVQRLALNELRSFSEILPILFLLSTLPKRTLVGFRNFVDYFLAQRLISMHFY